MQIHKLGGLGIAAETLASNFFTLSKASWLMSGAKADYDFIIYSQLQAESQTALGATTIQGGNTNTMSVISPTFYPFATEGAEMGGIVDDLSWADNNLEVGYEWIAVSATQYFVSGVLNSSQTLFNNPFEIASTRAFISGACWAGRFQSQVNPFV